MMVVEEDTAVVVVGIEIQRIVSGIAAGTVEGDAVVDKLSPVAVDTEIDNRAEGCGLVNSRLR